jgi:putative DNA primase/helicase
VRPQVGRLPQKPVIQLSWAVLGCLEWQRNGLQVPLEVQKATVEYFAQEDTVGRWLEQRCELRADYSENVSALWADWCQWTKSNNEFTGKEKARPDRNMKGHLFHWLKLSPPAWAQAAGVRS